MQQANLLKAKLQGANLWTANLIDAKNTNFEEIKLAQFWDQAIYKEDNNDNQKYIEKLRGN